MFPPEVKALHELFKAMLKQDLPMTYARLFRKRITPPNGYLSNECVKLTMASPFALINQGHVPDGDKSNAMAFYLAAVQMLTYDFPTYYITDSFCDAVWNSDPPPDMTLDGIQWPMPAMLFGLPTTWAQANLAPNMIPWIGVVHGQAGYTSTRELDYLVPEYGRQLWEVGSDKERIIFTYSDLYKKNDGSWSQMEHDGVYSQHFTVKEIENWEARSHGHFWASEDADDGYTPEIEAHLAKATRRFVIRLLLALNSAPHYVEYSESCLRKSKTKHGRTRDALWSPNWIGRSYKIKTSGPHSNEDPQWHVRMHWRRGHFRNQPFGQGRKQIRVIWIEPMLVGKSTTV